MSYRPVHDSDTWTDSPSASTVIAYVVLSLLLVYYILQQFDYFPLLSLPELAWNCLVYIIPSSLVIALDKRSHKSETYDGSTRSAYSDSRTFAAKSEAMRHILGLEAGGVLTRVQRARTLSGISTVFKTLKSDGLPGLGNWDNSCYQNSIIQGLASLPSLAAFLDQKTFDNASLNTRKTILALRKVIRELNDPDNAGRKLWTPSELKSMSSWQQQDAQEYFSKILNEVEKEASTLVNQKPRYLGLSELQNLKQGILAEREESRVEDTLAVKRRIAEIPGELASILLRNPLEGLLAQRVGCLQCGFVEGLSLIPFNCLTVPLGSKGLYNIKACLDEYMSLESINGVECFKCTLLRQKQQFERLLNQSQNLATSADPSVSPTISEVLCDTVKKRLKAVNDALDTEDFSENTLMKKCNIPVKNRVTTTKSRQAVIARLPQSLVLHVNRSVFNELTGVQSKNYALVKFPPVLDMSPWYLGKTAVGDTEASSVEIWNDDPFTSMLSKEAPGPGTDISHSRKNVFVLRAVVTHYGRHENGHYICYRRDPHMLQKDSADEPEKWWRLSDDNVSEVDEEHVLAQAGVFMLFYERLSIPEAPPARTGNFTKLSIASQRDKSPMPSDRVEHPESPSKTLLSDFIEHAGVKTDEGACLKAKIDNVPLQTTASTSEALKTLNLSYPPDPASVEVAVLSAIPDHKASEATSNTVKASPFINTSEVGSSVAVDTADKPNRQIPPPMRTSGSFRRTDSMAHGGSTMSSVSSMITAN